MPETAGGGGGVVQMLMDRLRALEERVAALEAQEPTAISIWNVAVSSTAPTDGQVLTYSSGTGKWAGA
jgi:hypothetical protein